MFLNFLSSETHLFISVRHFLLVAQRRRVRAREVLARALSSGAWARAGARGGGIGRIRALRLLRLSNGNAREVRMMTGSSDLLSVTVSYSAAQLTRGICLPCSPFSLGSGITVHALAAEERISAVIMSTETIAICSKAKCYIVRIFLLLISYCLYLAQN